MSPTSSGVRTRVAENLNQALHRAFAADESLQLFGEDVEDPYGGAFKATRGLSTSYPGRVISTPLSESGILGVGAGYALAGGRAIVEVMFGDFLLLGLDPLINFASKSVGMYGSPQSVPLVVRCPVGGNRGYGPTHSQHPSKHLIGVPHLALYEMSPLHDIATTFDRLLSLGTPAVYFEDKVLYTQQMCRDGRVDDIFRFDHIGSDRGIARVYVDDPDEYRHVIVAPGGLTFRALDAMRRLLLEDEIECVLLVPSRLYPLDVEPMLPLLTRAEKILVVEESPPGGTWATELAHVVTERLWGRLTRPVQVLHSQMSIIPTARHLESRILVQANDIYQALIGGADG